MSERSTVKKFDLILASLAGVLLLSYFLGFYVSSLPSMLSWILTYIPRTIPFNNFIIKKLTIDGQVDEIPRFLVTTGLSYLGFVIVSIETIRTAIKCSPQSVPFNVDLRTFYILSFFCFGIGIFFVAPSTLGTSGELIRLTIYTDFRYFMYFCYFVFLICFEFLIAFQAKEYFKARFCG